MTIDEESQSLVSVATTLNAAAGKRLVEHAEGVTTKMGLSGFFVVYSSLGMQLGSLAIGDGGTPLNVAIALDKIKTVLATRRSTSIQRDRMVSDHRDRADYGDQLGSLFGGGVAIFFNGQFVGAAAFSGALPEQDEEICVRTAVAASLDTDIEIELE